MTADEFLDWAVLEEEHVARAEAVAARTASRFVSDDARWARAVRHAPALPISKAVPVFAPTRPSRLRRFLTDSIAGRPTEAPMLAA